MSDQKPFKVVERGTGMTYGSSTTKAGARRIARDARTHRDSVGMHTNRIDIWHLEEEEGDTL